MAKQEEIELKNELSKSEMTVLRNAIKRGVYKEIFYRKMLTVQQLNELLANIKLKE